MAAGVGPENVVGGGGVVVVPPPRLVSSGSPAETQQGGVGTREQHQLTVTLPETAWTLPSAVSTQP